MWIHPKSHVFTLSCGSVQSEQKKSHNIISITIIAILGHMANILSAICAPVQPNSNITALLKDLMCAIQGVCGIECKPKFGQKKLKKGFFGPKLPFSRTRFFLSDQSLSIDINFSIGFVIAAELEFTIRNLFLVIIMMMMMDPTFAFHRDFL